MRNDSSVSTGRIRAPKHQAGSCRSLGTVDAAMIRPMFFHFVSKLRQISGQRSLHRALLFAVRQRCVLYVRAFWSSRRRIGATKRSTHPTGNIGDSRRRETTDVPNPKAAASVRSDQSRIRSSRCRAISRKRRPIVLPSTLQGQHILPLPTYLLCYRPQRLPRWFAK